MRRSSKHAWDANNNNNDLKLSSAFCVADDEGRADGKRRSLKIIRFQTIDDHFSWYPVCYFKTASHPVSVLGKHYVNHAANAATYLQFPWHRLDEQYVPLMSLPTVSLIDIFVLLSSRVQVEYKHYWQVFCFLHFSHRLVFVVLSFHLHQKSQMWFIGKMVMYLRNFLWATRFCTRLRTIGSSMFSQSSRSSIISYWFMAGLDSDSMDILGLVVEEDDGEELRRILPFSSCLCWDARCLLDSTLPAVGCIRLLFDQILVFVMPSIYNRYHWGSFQMSVLILSVYYLGSQVFIHQRKQPQS